MLRATILFAVGLCANVLIGLPAMAQAPAEVTLTRTDISKFYPYGDVSFP